MMFCFVSVMPRGSTINSIRHNNDHWLASTKGRNCAAPYVLLIQVVF